MKSDLALKSANYDFLTLDEKSSNSFIHTHLNNEIYDKSMKKYKLRARILPTHPKMKSRKKLIKKFQLELKISPKQNKKSKSKIGK